MMIWTHHHLSDSKVLELGMIPTMKNEHWSGSFTISSSHDTLTPVCAESERFVIKNSEEITGFKDRDCELRDTSIRYGPDHDIVFLGRNIVTYEDEKISDYNARVILNSTRILKGMCASSMRDSLKSITVDIKTWLHCHFLDKLTMFPHLECINLALVGRIRNGSRGEKRCSAAGGGLVFRDRYGLVDSPIVSRIPLHRLLQFYGIIPNYGYRANLNYSTGGANAPISIEVLVGTL